MSGEYDSELSELVLFLNAPGSACTASVIVDTEQYFRKLQIHFPPHLEGIEWRKANLIRSTNTGDDEPVSQMIDRLLQEWNAFRADIEMEDLEPCNVLSDDFYSAGICCPVRCLEEIIVRWSSLPHAFVVACRDFKACFYVSFNRSTYYGTAAQRHEA